MTTLDRLALVQNVWNDILGWVGMACKGALLKGNLLTMIFFLDVELFGMTTWDGLPLINNFGNDNSGWAGDIDSKSME
eukprot:1573718-Amphidinium_carterae.1